ncbi:hypothetical protein [Allorhodopirellula heiligendammensis]|uniref:Uncharacterized protein n=1 Tax=Allorhodopirellula heiligendammensis TaxID=2714739 RepID=A0A5C6BWN4_9BACT|nr:hypothetical protein [Allorhodopirellula heiligendammensis]TWU15089.1 hypothetical protein Poly21_22810 [Allorhodopirellula heiligendammensis]
MTQIANCVRTFQVIAKVILILMCCQCLVAAQTVDTSRDPDISAIRNRFQQSAGEFAFEISNSGEKLQLLDRPVSNWSNPERKTPAGALFVWTLNGRPEMVMSTYPTDAVGNFEHEFQSLSVNELVGTLNGRLIWEPRGDAIQWQQVSDKIPVGKTPSMRLVQMRRIAGLYTASLKFGDQPNKLLRLQTTPLYRFDIEKLPHGVLDGAMFAFVQGTDPEVIMLVEARKNADGEELWFVSFARMTVVTAQVEYQSNVVWEVQWGRTGFDSHYNVFRSAN